MLKEEALDDTGANLEPLLRKSLKQLAQEAGVSIASA
jgi:hypothetical protein